MKKLWKSQATSVRKQFISRFVDTEHPRFVDRIQTLRTFSDGTYYTGYLWDYMIDRRFIAFTEVRRFLERFAEPIYVFWDLHSADRIKIPDYWKHGRDTVLECLPSDFLANLDTLPDDIYTCDTSMNWAISLTHEWIGAVRQCVWVGDDRLMLDY